MKLEEQIDYNEVYLRFITASIMWYEDKNNPTTTKELMEAAKRFISVVEQIESPDQEDIRTRRKAYLKIAEILYRKHSERVMEGTCDASDVEGLQNAKDCCETVLPYPEFSDGEQFQMELDDILLYIDILQFLENITGERQYVEKWHTCAITAFEASKIHLQGEKRGPWYIKRLLNPIISAKYLLGDLDEGEALIPLLQAAGEKAESVDMIKEAYQKKREELKPKKEKPKRKKLFGLF